MFQVIESFTVGLRTHLKYFFSLLLKSIHLMDLLFFLIFEDVAQNKTLEYSRNDLLGFLKANNMKKLAQT